MAAKLVVGSIAGLGVLAGGALLAGRLGGREQAGPTTPAEPTPVAESPQVPVDAPGIVLDERAPAEDDGAFSINDRPGFQAGGKVEAREAVKIDMLDRFDADGDGELSEAETLAAKETFRAEREARRQQWLLEKYDADGDGVLSDAERAQVDQDRAEREARWAERQAENLRRAIAAYDADGDGALSEAEKDAGRKERSVYMTQKHEAFRTQFDADQDGQVSGSERAAMHEAMGDVFGQMRFVRSFDSNGDHAISVADMPAYMDMFSSGDNRADLDGNGVVNESDLALFQEKALAPADPRVAQAMDWFENAPPSVDGGPGGVMVMSSTTHALNGTTEVTVTVHGGDGSGLIPVEGDGHMLVIETIRETRDD